VLVGAVAVDDHVVVIVLGLLRPILCPFSFFIASAFFYISLLPTVVITTTEEGQQQWQCRIKNIASGKKRHLPTYRQLAPSIQLSSILLCS
jgi:hypothetical protein